MSDAKRKILELLEAGAITQEDAQRLLDALGEDDEGREETTAQGDASGEETAHEWAEDEARIRSEFEHAGEVFSKANQDFHEMMTEKRQGQTAEDEERIRSEFERAAEVFGEAGQAFGEMMVEKARKQTVRTTDIGEPDEAALEQEVEAAVADTMANIDKEVEASVAEAMSGIDEEIEAAVEESRRELEHLGEPAGQRPGIGQIIRQAVNAAFKVKEAAKKIPELTLHPDFPDISDIPDFPVPGEELLAPVDGVDETRSEARITQPEIESILIEWNTDSVTVLPYDGSDILITETASKPLEDWQRLAYGVDHETLYIRWCNGQKMRLLNPENWNLRKKLEVLLPAGMAGGLEQLSVKNGSGAVLVSGLRCEEMSLASGSGMISAQYLEVEDLSLSAGSGKVDLKEVTGENVHVSAGSGSMEIGGVRAEALHVSAGSGSIKAEDVTCEDDVKIHAGSGSVSAVRVTGETVTIETASGSQSVDDIQGEEGVTLGTVSGSLHVTNLCTEENAKLTTVSGGVKAEGLTVEEQLIMSSVSGSIKAQLEGMPEGIRADTVSGGATLILPDTDTGFTLRYKGGGSYPDSDFHLTGEMKKGGGVVSYGDGGTNISFSTVSGRIGLKKA